MIVESAVSPGIADVLYSATDQGSQVYCTTHTRMPLALVIHLCSWYRLDYAHAGVENVSPVTSPHSHLVSASKVTPALRQTNQPDKITLHKVQDLIT